LAWLDEKKMLLRVYTQNVDGLEELAGVSKHKVVYAHGSLLHATCMKCGAKYTAQDIAGDVKDGRVPMCQRSKERRKKFASKNTATKLPDQPVHTRTLRKRSFQQYSEVDEINTNANDGLCGGVVKPNITFFGETLAHDVGLCFQRDSARADALIIMGTSLSV
jgi:NAD-dependent SIR2 family protein deacetylase